MQQNKVQFFPEVWLPVVLVGPLFLLFAFASCASVLLLPIEWFRSGFATISPLILVFGAAVSFAGAFAAWKFLKPRLAYARAHSKTQNPDQWLEANLHSKVASFARGRIRFMQISIQAAGATYTPDEYLHSFGARQAGYFSNGALERKGSLLVRDAKPVLFTDGSFRIWFDDGTF